MPKEFCNSICHKLTSQRNEDDLRTILDRLLEAGLLSRQGVPPDARYLFKHALVQDAAYGMLLREPRRALHARIAEAAPDSPDSFPGPLVPEAMKHLGRRKPHRGSRA
jgi:predicted ATPase